MPSKEAWEARNMLVDACWKIETACVQANKDPQVYDRLAEFDWGVITGSLEELAAELLKAGEFLVNNQPMNPWEETEHLCGYSVFMGESESCFHEGCWEDGGVIAVALEIKQLADQLLHNFVVEKDPSRPYPQTEDEAHTCQHGNKYWFGHECGLCMEES